MERMTKIGRIKPLKGNVKNNRFGVGLEKLDRYAFDPSKVYDRLGDLGVTWIRIQSGWPRTEKVEGVYDFIWLDEIVDNLLARGLRPWMCLCYGNELYTETAKLRFGGVGYPPIFSEKEKNAWKAYCTAVAEHFKGRVWDFEVWNEPDGNHTWIHGASGKEYAEFLIDTSVSVKSVIPEARIIGGSVCRAVNLHWIEEMFQCGAGAYMDALTYHEYQTSELRAPEAYRVLRATIDQYNPNISLIMGEVGIPSVSDGHGAHSKHRWNEDLQAKLLLRRGIVDFVNGVEFFSWFTAVDMCEDVKEINKDIKTFDDFGFFGVLAAQFDENGVFINEYNPKKSYYALRTLASFLQGAKVRNLPIISRIREGNFKDCDWSMRYDSRVDEAHTLYTAGFVKENSSAAYVYWKPNELLKGTYNNVVSVTVSAGDRDMAFADLMSGKIYRIPDTMVESMGSGVYRLKELPVYEFPVALLLGDFCEMEKML